MPKPTSLRYFENGFVKFSLLFVSLTFAFITSKLLEVIIRPSNPADIQNLYAAAGKFNPAENFIRILWIAVFSIVFYKCLSLLLAKKPLVFRVIFIFLAVFSILSIEIVSRIQAYKGNLDTFHNGEQLSPANDFNAGKGLYSGMFVLHGAGEDVLVPSLALHAAHKGANPNGISTYYFLTSILELISAALFISLLAILFENTALFIATTLWFVLGMYSSFDYARDIFTWLIFGLIFYVVVRRNNKHKTAAYIGVGGLSSAAIFYAIDRGLIATFLAILLTLTTLFVKTADNGKLSLTLPKKMENYKNAAFIIGSMLVVQLIGLLILGFGQYKDFLITYFVDIPKYEGLLFDYPLRTFNTANFTLWIPIILIPFATLMLNALVRSGKKINFGPSEVFAFLLLATGILFLQGGYGRYDAGHVAYSTPVLFVAVFYISWLYTKKFYADKEKLWLPVVAIGLLFIPISTIDVSRLSALVNVSPGQVKQVVTLPSIPDREWIPSYVQQVTNFITNNTSKSDPIFVFTQQPIYYYLTDRRNPTRFYIPWFADPKPLETELLASLKKDNPKYILYSGGTGWDDVDGSTMQQRTPTVDAWIRANYPVQHLVGAAIILSKN